MPNSPVHVIYTGDDGVASRVATSMRSVIENASNPAAIKLHMVHAMSEANRDLIQASLPSVNNINFVDGTTLISNLPMNTGRVIDSSQGYWLRIFAADLIPDIDIAVYLDGDTICVTDIAQLASIDLKGNPVGAIADNFSTFENSGLDGFWGTHEPYFNSGVLVCDFAQWRDERVAEQIVDLALVYGRTFEFLDQDCLNITFKNRWTDVCENDAPDAWNNRQVSRLARLRRDRAEVLAQFETAKIVHYTTPAKPDTDAFPQDTLPFELWWKYQSQTAFADAGLKPMKVMGWETGLFAPTPEQSILIAAAQAANAAAN